MHNQTKTLWTAKRPIDLCRNRKPQTLLLNNEADCANGAPHSLSARALGI